MRLISNSIRRPSGFESITCTKKILEESWKQFPSIRNLFSLVQTGDDGSLGFIVSQKNDTNPPKRLIEIHLDEVSIHCTKPYIKNIGVPVWFGIVNGNLKYHVWGEPLDLYCITRNTQKKIGKGYVM